MRLNEPDMTSKEHFDYHAGRDARKAGRGKESCDRWKWSRKHWWLAGWHDQDMETCDTCGNGE